MTTIPESELRAALHERADLVPDPAISRLVQFDYRPRTNRLAAPLALKAAGASAAAAGAAVAIASLSTGAAPAFAGWTPKPTRPLPAELANANADCTARSPIPGLPLVLTDTRGPYTFSVYADGTSNATCITGPSFKAASGSSSSVPVAAPTGQILLSSSHSTDRGGQAFSFAEGRVGTGVSAVKLVLDDGTSVDATVGNGWFVAWWPTTHDVASAAVTTPSGSHTQTFPTAPQPPAGSSGGRVSGSSFSSGSGSSRGARVGGFSSVSR